MTVPAGGGAPLSPDCAPNGLAGGRVVWGGLNRPTGIVREWVAFALIQAI